MRGSLVYFMQTGQTSCGDKMMLPAGARYQWPMFGIDRHGSCGGRAVPRCNNSTD